ncbi:tyrosine-type recombinase/integrase [Microbacterium thalli]|uniref:tyrosine-type recombinase/integrase n=1 Tax=Microbacterium thalli TaxID=3027921 RepID=UPI003B679975
MHPPHPFPRVTPHDLRHTAASLAISAGANVEVVQRMPGHASAAMTPDTYADLFDDDLDNGPTHWREPPMRPALETSLPPWKVARGRELDERRLRTTEEPVESRRAPGTLPRRQRDPASRVQLAMEPRSVAILLPRGVW